MRIDLNKLVQQIQQLGIDSGPLTEFQSAVLGGYVLEADYIQILNTLKNQLLKTYSVRQKPMSVQLLLDRVKNKLDIDLKNVQIQEINIHRSNSDLRGIKDIVSEQSKQSQDLNLEILNELRSMKEEVKELKSKNTTVVINKDTQESYPIDNINNKSDGVFVNPIDETRVSNLKPKIKIESKKGSSDIKDRIKRLKALKNDQ